MVCSKEKRRVKKGDRIHVHYSGMMLDGSEFETTFDKDPYDMIVGETKIIKGFEKALVGMEEDETMTVIFPPEEAYGSHDSSLIAVLKQSELPKNSVPSIGWMMKIGTYNVTVVAKDDTTVTLDGNHPLVDKHVNFKIQVLKIF
jgi:FKBP-type peptidyl-prolyl cis-trans isomerase 2